MQAQRINFTRNDNYLLSSLAQHWLSQMDASYKKIGIAIKVNDVVTFLQYSQEKISRANISPVHCNFFPSKLITYKDWMKDCFEKKKAGIDLLIDRNIVIFSCATYARSDNYWTDCLQNVNWDWSSWSKTVERNRRWILLSFPKVDNLTV